MIAPSVGAYILKTGSNMGYTLKQVASTLGTKVVGVSDIEIDGVAEPVDAGPRELALAMKPEFADKLAEGSARAAMLWADADWQSYGLEAAILVPRPRYAMSEVTKLMDLGQGWTEGIHPSALVDPEAELGEGVSVGAFSIVSAGAKIGRDTKIGPQVFIGRDVEIGAEGYIREGVKIGARVQIGASFIAQPGAAIGGDGFSFVTEDVSGVENVRETLGDRGEADAQMWTRIHSLGSVEIGNNVEVGANTTIDCGTVRSTRIGSGTKLDNLVMIGHNVVVGENCLLCGQVGIAGSTKIGNNVVLGGKTGVSDNVFVGDNVITGGGTIVLTNIPSGRVMLGYPAMKMDATVELFKGFRRLRRLFDDVAELKKRVSNRSETD